jgi:hypothetical protein
MLVATKCYKNLGYFDSNLPVVEDWDFWLKLAREYNVISTNKILALYRVVHNSMSTNIERMLKYKLDVLEKNLKIDLSDQTKLSKTEREAYSRVYLTAAVEYLQNGDQLNAYECFYTAFDMYPQLVHSVEVINEIFWGSVPRGFRGCFDFLDFNSNSEMMFNILKKLYRDPGLNPAYKRIYKKACGNAYYIISLNSYNAGINHDIWQQWLSALNIAPSIALSKRFTFLLSKTLVNKEFVNKFKRWKQILL